MVWERRLKSQLIFAALAQLDRVFGYEPKGRGFESLTPCQKRTCNFCCESFFACELHGIRTQWAKQPSELFCERWPKIFAKRYIEFNPKRWAKIKNESLTPKNTAEKDTFCSIFLSKSQTWYIIAARRISSRFSVYIITEGVFLCDLMIYNAPHWCNKGEARHFPKGYTAINCGWYTRLPPWF